VGVCSAFKGSRTVFKSGCLRACLSACLREERGCVMGNKEAGVKKGESFFGFSDHFLERKKDLFIIFIF
jgi:hypothetical protein